MKESVGHIVGLQLVKQVVLNGGMYSTLLNPKGEERHDDVTV
jgi:hypothetical protein